MPFLSFDTLEKVTSGKWLVDPSCARQNGIGKITDDSRSLPEGALFLAIPGELTDGHKYVPNALHGGAAAILVQNAPEDALLEEMKCCGCPCLQVEDSLRAYQQLALWHRRQFPQAKILAITGSCGKTSTKEMIASILEQRFPGGVLKTIGSTNNHFGVPRNLYRMDGSTKVAVIEMGTNHPGEIANLVSLAPPEVGVVCNIGCAHLEFFHDLYGVAMEKSSILAGTLPAGCCVYPADATGVEILRDRAGERKCLSFGKGDDADVHYEYLGFKDGKFILLLRWKQTGIQWVFDWSLGGEHMAANAACAAAAATALGCTPEEVVAGLRKCVLPGARLEVKEVDGIHWVNDAFNANPTSTHAAIDWFAEVVPAGAPAILVLGDMLELGEGALQAHEEILAYARKACPDARLLTVGVLMRLAAEKLADHSLENCADAEAAKAILDREVLPGSWILLKSSHGIGLSKVAP